MIMRKIYPFLLLFPLLTSIATPDAHAQWNENLSENLLISESGYNFQDLARIGRTPDEKVFISWISWENQSAYLKLQLLDKDGNALFAQGGIYVSRQPTPTWSSGYGFSVTEDGCAILVNCDTRNGLWQPYAYKVSQTGEQLWGTDGVPLTESGTENFLNPQVCVTHAGNILVGFQQLSDYASDIRIGKRYPDGTNAWGGFISIPCANGIFNMTPSGNDAAIVTYYEAGNGNYAAMRYTGNGEEAWSEKKRLDDSGLVKTTAEPNVRSDGADGIIAGWRYANSGFSVAGKAQRLDADGNCLFDPEGIFLDDMPLLCMDRQQSLYAAYALGDNGDKLLVLEKYDKQGRLLWKIDDSSIAGYAYQLALYGMVPTTDGILLVYRNASSYNQATIEYSKISADGKVIRSNETVSNAPDDKGRGEMAVLENQFVITWADNGSAQGKGYIFAQNVRENVETSITKTMDNRSGQLAVRPEANGKSLRIRLPDTGIRQASVRLTDLQGRTIAPDRTIYPEKGEAVYDCTRDRLPTGIYLITVQTGKDKFAGKFIIH